MINTVVSQMSTFLRPMPQMCAHEFFFLVAAWEYLPLTPAFLMVNWRLMLWVDIGFPLKLSVLTDNTSYTFVWGVKA